MYALDEGKAIIVVVNKWDVVDKDEHTMQEFTTKLRQEFKFIDYAPIVYVSALKKTRIHTVFDAIELAYEGATKRIQTSVLNGIILDAYQMNPTPDFNGGRLKILYGNQVSTKPPTIVLFVNDPNFMHFSYRRYLGNQLRRAFGFDGSPIRIVCRKSS